MELVSPSIDRIFLLTAISVLYIPINARAAEIDLDYDRATGTMTPGKINPVIDYESPVVGMIKGLMKIDELRVNDKPVNLTPCPEEPKGKLCFTLPRLNPKSPSYIIFVKPTDNNGREVKFVMNVVLRTKSFRLPPIALELVDKPKLISKRLIESFQKIKIPDVADDGEILDIDVRNKLLESYGCKLPYSPEKFAKIYKHNDGGGIADKYRKADGGIEGDYCASAMVTISPNGSISYNSNAETGTFCLSKGVEWGEVPIVRYRESTQSINFSECVIAKPGTTYFGFGGSKDKTVGRLEVFASPTEEILKKYQDEASENGQALFARYIRSGLVRSWLSENEKKFYSADSEIVLAAIVLNSTYPSRSSIEKFERLKSSMEQAINDYFNSIEQWKPESISKKNWDIEINNSIELITKNMPSAPWEVYLSGRNYLNYLSGIHKKLNDLADQIEPSIQESSRAIRALAVANQELGKIIIPFLVFSGDFPTWRVGNLIALGNKREFSNDSKRYYEGSEVMLFAYDVPQKGSALIIQTDEKVTREASEVAKIAAVGIQMGLAWFNGNLFLPSDAPTGGGHPAAAPKKQQSGSESDLKKITEINWPQKGFPPECYEGDAFNHIPEYISLDDAGLLESLEREWNVLCRFYNRKNQDSFLAVLSATQALRSKIVNLVSDKYYEKFNKFFVETVLPAFFDGNFESANGLASADMTSMVILEKLSGGVAYLLKVCADRKDCDLKTDPSKVIVSRKIKVYNYPSYYSFAVDVGVITPITVNGQSSLPVGGYRYEGVEVPIGSQRMYQLRPSDKATDHITISTYIVIFPFARCENEWTERLGIGIGPTVWQGGSGDFGKHWHFRLLWSPPKFEGLLFGVGLGVQWINVPAFVPVNSYVSVPSGDKPPDFRTDSVPQLLFSAGIALDLSILVDAGKNIIDKIKQPNGAADGGKK